MSRKEKRLLAGMAAFVFITLSLAFGALILFPAKQSEGLADSEEVTAIVILGHQGEATKEAVMAIEDIGGEVLSSTARDGEPALIVRLPQTRIAEVAALSNVSLIETQDLLTESDIPAQALPPLEEQPGHGPDGEGQEPLTTEDIVRKEVLRLMEEELVTQLQWDKLSEDELAKVDGVVRNKMYWAVFNDPAVSSRVEAEVAQALANDGNVELDPSTLEAIEAAINEQTIITIIEIDGPLDEASLGTISDNVTELRNALGSINAVSVEVTPVQLVSTIQLSITQYIWDDAPAREEVDESIPQIGADDIHTIGIEGDGVRVAVVDRGFQDSHPAYSSGVVAERSCPIGYNRDNSHHATHIAGIIAGDNSLVTGVAPDAELVDAVVCPGLFEAYWSDTIQAIEWAANDAEGDADVINVSLGADLWEYPRDGTGPVETAVDNVITQDGLDSYHTMVVKSAGNDGEHHDTGVAYQDPDPGTMYIYWHDVNVDVHNDTSDSTLVITLWWDDASNDLDLTLFAPDGTEWDTSTGSPGGIAGDNPGIIVEQVEASVADLQSFGDDTWRVRVAGYDVANEPQDYHLSIDTGDGEFDSPNPVGTITVPGNARYVLTVGSVQDGSVPTSGGPWTPTVVNALSDFSSQGPTDDDPSWGYRIKPEIMAPGEWVLSSFVNGYGWMAGTSQSAPHVSGVIALLLDAAGQRTDGTWLLNWVEVRGAIIDTAEIIDNNQNMDNVTGAGLVRPTNAIFNGTVTNGGDRYFLVTPRYTSSTYPGTTGQVTSFGWESVAAHWDSSSSDIDLYLYRLDTGNMIVSAASSNPTYEKIDGVGAASDDYNYVLRVHGSDVSGSEEFFGVSTNVIQSADPPDLSVTANASNPNEAEVGDSFTIRFDVHNTGELPTCDTLLTLNLPSGVELVSGSSTQNVGVIQAGNQTYATWTVQGTSTGAKTLTVDASTNCWGVDFTAAGTDSVQINPPPNNPPYEPNTPFPSDGETGVPVSTILSWVGGDPDTGDTVTYDVYLEADDTKPDVMVCAGVSTTSCPPVGDLDYDTHYYWRVVARDYHGATTSSVIWDFWTEAPPTTPTPDTPTPTTPTPDTPTPTTPTPDTPTPTTPTPETPTPETPTPETPTPTTPTPETPTPETPTPETPTPDTPTPETPTPDTPTPTTPTPETPTPTTPTPETPTPEVTAGDCFSFNWMMFYSYEQAKWRMVNTCDFPVTISGVKVVWTEWYEGIVLDWILIADTELWGSQDGMDPDYPDGPYPTESVTDSMGEDAAGWRGIEITLQPGNVALMRVDFDSSEGHDGKNDTLDITAGTVPGDFNGTMLYFSDGSQLEMPPE